MAIIVNKYKIMDGPSHVTLHCYLQGDGASPDLVNYVLLDPMTELTPFMPQQQDLILKQVWYEVAGFNCTLGFGTLTGSWPFWVLTPGVDSQHDWRFFGGIRDRSDAVSGLNSTGKLVISTTGLLTANTRGAFVLWLEKRDRADPQPD